MAALFIDSTYDITLGILDENLGWIQFERFSNQKASAIIQTQTNNLLIKSNLKISDIESIITVAGPGFYTGLRLSEGFADVFSFSNRKILSFLSYDIPAYSGVKSGVWMTKAYRGEYFFHFWDEHSSRNELVQAKNLSDFMKTIDMDNFYIHSDAAVDDISRQYFSNPKTTFELLKENSDSVFEAILKAQPRIDSFYFRAPEDEFKVSL